jgi:hypothetical protein
MGGGRVGGWALGRLNSGSIGRRRSRGSRPPGRRSRRGIGRTRCRGLQSLEEGEHREEEEERLVAWASEEGEHREEERVIAGHRSRESTKMRSRSPSVRHARCIFPGRPM